MDALQSLQCARRMRLVLIAVLWLPAGAVHAPIALAAPSPSTPMFDVAGAHVGVATLRLSALGRGENRTILAAAAPEDDSTRVQYRHGDVTEWYLRQGMGIEQGMTLCERPAGDGPLMLDVATPGTIVYVDDDALGATLLLPMAGNVSRWRYTDLRVTDAAGQAVRSYLEATAAGVAIIVDDREAAYPLVVDPYMLQQTLTDPLTASGDHFGRAVAVSSDGSTVVVGADGAGTSFGRTYIYSRSGGSYGSPTILTDPGGATNYYFGRAVAVSGDGSIVVVGAYGTVSGVGEVYIYMKSGGSFPTTPNQALMEPTLNVNDFFGFAVAVSGDGSTLVVGASGTSSFQGRAYVYTKSGSSYGSPATLTEPMAANNDRFGSAVAVSGDGSTVVVGAPYGTPSSPGRAYVFTKSSGSYGTPVTLSDPVAAAGDLFGFAVAVSGDGSTVVVGAPYTSGTQGQAYIYTKNGGSYGSPVTLTDPGAAGNDRFGTAVAASQNGGIVVVGSFFMNNLGRAYVYLRSGGNYGTPAILSGATNDGFGSAVTVSQDASTLVVGAPSASNSQGKAYVYSSPLVAPTAVNHRYEIAMNTPLVVAPFTGLLSGSSLGFPPATITADSTPGHGTVSIAADGSFTYTPMMGYSGTDSFTYTLANSAGMSMGTVMITVVNGVVSPKPGSHMSGAVSGTTPRTQPTGHASGTVSGSTPIPQPPRH